MDGVYLMVSLGIVPYNFHIELEIRNIDIHNQVSVISPAGIRDDWQCIDVTISAWRKID